MAYIRTSELFALANFLPTSVKNCRGGAGLSSPNFILKLYSKWVAKPSKTGRPVGLGISFLYMQSCAVCYQVSTVYTYSCWKSVLSITKLALLSKHFCAPKCCKTHIQASRISKKILGRTLRPSVAGACAPRPSRRGESKGGKGGKEKGRDMEEVEAFLVSGRWCLLA